VFLKGHALRLEISGSNFPRFDRNPGRVEEFHLAHAAHAGGLSPPNECAAPGAQKTRPCGAGPLELLSMENDRLLHPIT
jgi:predicted acyl esterase